MGGDVGGRSEGLGALGVMGREGKWWEVDGRRYGGSG